MVRQRQSVWIQGSRAVNCLSHAKKSGARNQMGAVNPVHVKNQSSTCGKNQMLRCVCDAVDQVQCDGSNNYEKYAKM